MLLSKDKNKLREREREKIKQGGVYIVVERTKKPHWLHKHSIFIFLNDYQSTIKSQFHRSILFV